MDTVKEVFHQKLDGQAVAVNWHLQAKPNLNSLYKMQHVLSTNITPGTAKTVK